MAIEGVPSRLGTSELNQVSCKIIESRRTGAENFSLLRVGLGLSPKDGQELRGDVGILRGNGLPSIGLG